MYTEQRTFVRTLCRNYKTSGIVATFESLDLSWRDVMVWIQIPRNGLESGDTGRGERGRKKMVLTLNGYGSLITDSGLTLMMAS